MYLKGSVVCQLAPIQRTPLYSYTPILVYTTIYTPSLVPRPNSASLMQSSGIGSGNETNTHLLHTVHRESFVGRKVSLISLAALLYGAPFVSKLIFIERLILFEH